MQARSAGRNLSLVRHMRGPECRPGAPAPSRAAAASRPAARTEQDRDSPAAGRKKVEPDQIMGHCGRNRGATMILRRDLHDGAPAAAAGAVEAVPVGSH
eukprot:756238-Hanusia_phi.AAC.1